MAQIFLLHHPTILFHWLDQHDVRIRRGGFKNNHSFSDPIIVQQFYFVSQQIIVGTCDVGILG